MRRAAIAATLPAHLRDEYLAAWAAHDDEGCSGAGTCCARPPSTPAGFEYPAEFLPNLQLAWVDQPTYQATRMAAKRHERVNIFAGETPVAEIRAKRARQPR